MSADGTSRPKTDGAVVLDTVELAVKAMRAGQPVLVVDDESRENEGDVIFAAEHVTAELIAFMMSECRGLICVAMAAGRLDQLDVPPMTRRNTERHRTAFAVSVDARDGISSGISAVDRALTIGLLARPDSIAEQLVQPGHVFPLRAAVGGVLERRGHTEAAVDLARAAGLQPAGVICEVADGQGRMLRGPALRSFADRHGMPLISIEDLAAHVRHSPNPP